MLHLFDAGHERMVGLPAPGRHGLRLRVHLACPERVVGWDEVRALVVSDVLLRTLEAQGTQVFPALALPELSPMEKTRLGRILAGYGVRMLEADEDLRSDVHLLTGADIAPVGSGVVLRVGGVSVTASEPVLSQELTDRVAMARRCMLLGAPYREPVTVSPDGLHAASTALAGWRARVAAWSQAPSAPVRAAIRDRARSRLDADLDTPGLLALLQKVADDPGLPDGARFETFLWLDRFLGLELGGELGRDLTDQQVPG